MPVLNPDAPVTVIVDGVNHTVKPGLYTMPEFQAAIGRPKNPISKLSITTSAPAQPTTINGNDSFTIRGGEAMTSTAGL